MTHSSRHLTLYLLTLNCARLPQPPEELAQSLSSTLPATAPNLILLSLQELAPLAESFMGGGFITPYVDSISDAINTATTAVYGLQYDLLGFHNVGLTAVLAFVHPESAASVAGVQWAGIGLGVAGMGNKGAVSLRLVVGGIQITAVGAHWAPDEFQADRRDKDWEALVRGLVFDDGAQIYPTQKNGQLFLFGDLNYRTADERPEPGTVFPRADGPREEWVALLEGDQLSQRRLAGTTLHALEETPVTFPPTYKYRVEDENVFAAKRWPSWTDRVLFLPSPTLHVERYDSIQSYRGSDHKPVFAVFRIRVDEEQEGEGAAVAPPWKATEGSRARREIARKGEYWVGAAWMGAKNSAGLLPLFLAIFLVYNYWWR
jgi:hypothetical protein